MWSVTDPTLAGQGITHGEMTALQVADRPYSVSFGGGDDGLVHEVECSLR
jgi:hypothetical protein